MKEVFIIGGQLIMGRWFDLYGLPEEPLFLVKDIADWIGYAAGGSNRLTYDVDEGDKVKYLVEAKGRGRQEAWFVTESGFYDIMLISNKPAARAFKKEIKKLIKSKKFIDLVSSVVYDDGVGGDIASADSGVNRDLKLFKDAADIIANLPQPRDSLSNAGHIYVAEYDGFIKIGMTRNVKIRMKSLDTECRKYNGYGIKRIALSDKHFGFSDNETELHKHFGDYRIDHSEFFTLSFEDCVEEINKIFTKIYKYKIN